MVSDFLAITACEQKAAVVRFDFSPTASAERLIGKLIRSFLEVVLAMATILSAQFDYSGFELNRFACEMTTRALAAVFLHRSLEYPMTQCGRAGSYRRRRTGMRRSTPPGLGFGSRTGRLCPGRNGRNSPAILCVWERRFEMPPSAG